MFDYHAREGSSALAYLIITKAPNWFYDFALGGETL
jgi:hypothetical protein